MKRFKDRDTSPDQNSSFIDNVQDRMYDLFDRQRNTEHNVKQLLYWHHYQNPDKVNLESEIIPKIQRAKDNTTEKMDKLDQEFPHEIKPVGYYENLLDLQCSLFKKTIGTMQRYEQTLYDGSSGEELRKIEGFEQDRSELKDKIAEEVRLCRHEKQELRSHMLSNLEKPSELASSLIDETGGPDDTGGDS